MSFLKINNISKTYPGQHKKAVDNICLELEEGEVLAIVGENGSGKTTLMKLINGLEDADTGEIFFQDKPVTGPSLNLVPGHPHIKMLTQKPNLFPRHTIRENLGYNIRTLSSEDQKNKIQELVTLCQLQGMEEKLPTELSGGQQQRAALAKAIADNPSLLLMDEPFSNLDLFLRDEIKKKVIQRIRGEGKGAIFVTHDVKDALELADRIAVLKEGKLQQYDSPEVIYERPANEYVAYLFGKVNILDPLQFAKTFQLGDHKKFSRQTKIFKACVRPEHIKITNEAMGQASGKVTYVGYLGDSYELEVLAGEITLRVNTRKKHFAAGDKIFLKVSPSRIHLF